MLKLKLILLSLIMFAGCKETYENTENTAADFHIIPKPQSLTPKKGKFEVSPATKIISDDNLSNEAVYLSDLLTKTVGSTIEITEENETKNKIQLELDPSIENDEAYLLDVNSNRIHLKAKTATGIFYGMQTLRQLMPAAIENEKFASSLLIPAVSISDAPSYKYRGMHLDVGRHMFPVAFIKKYIDLIAMHKMNTFHWHLTEDQGWRIEIKKYKKLTEVGSVRKETIKDKNFDPYIGDEIPYGGFYTQEEVKDIVAYAAKNHVTVVPEIELPGHSLAAIAAYPELGNTGKQLEVGTKWGVYDHIYAPKEETFAFLEDVLTEIMALFPSKYIHIGGDEAPKKEWKESSLAQEVIRREGLKDEHELQSYFIRRIEKFLNSHDRDIIGWDEILEGGLAPNATVMSWRGIEGGIEAARQNHNVIMTPGSHCYFDHYQVDKDEQNEEPLAIGGFTSVEKVYSYNPTPEVLTEEQKKFILGAQANLWTEYIKTPEYAEYMILPRMTALSEVVWTSAENKNWDDFKTRLLTFKKRYDAMGLNYAKHVFAEPEKN